MAIAMWNNNYLSLINFKVKLCCQRLFFMNEHDVGDSFIKKKSDDEVLLWNQLDSNNYYLALQ